MGKLAYILQSRSSQWYDIIEQEFFGLHSFLQYYPQDFFISRENGSLFVSLIPPDSPNYSHHPPAYPSPYPSNRPYRHHHHHPPPPPPPPPPPIFPSRKPSAHYQSSSFRDSYSSYGSQDPYHGYNEGSFSHSRYGDGQGRSHEYSLFDMYVPS